MSLVRRFHLMALTVLGVLVVIWAGAFPERSSADVDSAMTQDPSSLDRRISMLEQRFYSLESSMNRLQQFVASQRSSAPASDARDREIGQISQEVQRLQLRLIELQCGLLKLDERTLSTTRRSGEPRPTDPCRANPDTPLRLSPRP